MQLYFIVGLCCFMENRNKFFSLHHVNAYNEVTEIKSCREVKSQTSLISLQFSCKRALSEAWINTKTWRFSKQEHVNGHVNHHVNGTVFESNLRSRGWPTWNYLANKTNFQSNLKFQTSLSQTAFEIFFI